MKLAEALSILAKAPSGALPLRITLACGFTPLHLGNYVAAFLQQAHPERKVSLEMGLFGDVSGTLAKFAASQTGTCVMALEWSDLDPRLGYRQTGGWGQRVVSDVLDSVSAQLTQLQSTIETLTSATRLVICLPTLDLPPAFHTVGIQASEAEILLQNILSGFAAKIVAHPSVSLVSAQHLESLSPASGRYDFRSDLNTGFPYTQQHAAALGSIFAKLVRPASPKKGLITDLDDTFWRGLVGEIGSEAVSWDLGSHSQVHGLYQQMLKALAEHGVLVAIASKNSPAVVMDALGRTDLVMEKAKIFPIEVHWEPKSESVTRILKTWNIGADSVVFVDDSPMELAEVKAVHPDVECLLFKKEDYAASLALLHQLRDLFGKPRLSEEDSFRLQSIRQAAQFFDQAKTGSVSQLLASAGAILTLDFTVAASDKRTLDLVNKTNQFNLNGKRYTEEEWSTSLQQAGSFLLAISYEDKFGPLGKIGVVKGIKQDDRVVVDTWVLSCRAFSRHIEFQTLAQLFAYLDASQIEFAYSATAKNQPVTDFLAPLQDELAGPTLLVTMQRFLSQSPQMHHLVKIIS